MLGPIWIVALTLAALSIPDVSSQSIKTVTVDLNSSSFTGELPFDVPFYLGGTVATTTQQVCVWYRLVAKTGDEAQRNPDHTNCPALRPTNPPTPYSPGEKLSGNSPWIYGGTWSNRFSTPTPASGQPFRLRIAPLDHSQEYTFLFIYTTPPSPTRLTAFRNQALVELDKDLQEPDGPYLDARAVRAIQTNAVTAIEQTLLPQEALITKGTLLGGSDLAAEFAGVATLKNLSQDVRTYHNRLTNVQVPAVKNALSALKANGDMIEAWADAATALADMTDNASSPSYASIAAALQDLTALTQLSQNGRVAFACAIPSSVRTSSLKPVPAGKECPTDYPLQVWRFDLTSTRGAAATATAERLRKISSALTLVRTQMALSDETAQTFANAVAEGNDVDVSSVDEAQVSAALDQLQILLRDLQGEFAVERRGMVNTWAELTRLLTERRRALEAVANGITLRTGGAFEIAGTTSGSFETRSENYISVDVGLTYLPEGEEALPYLGLNFYTKPVNKDAPLRGWDVRKRFAFMVGITATRLEGERIRGIVYDRALLLGAGVRLTDFVRATVGVSVFESEDPPPFSTQSRVSWSPFVSLSLDWDATSAFRGLFRSIIGS
ncbi:MAG: hypothetical protein AAGG50_01045 [Bacteroidota bacterium]